MAERSRRFVMKWRKRLDLTVRLKRRRPFQTMRQEFTEAKYTLYFLFIVEAYKINVFIVTISKCTVQ